jgi:Fe-S cluster biogenesis protein NfuA
MENHPLYARIQSALDSIRPYLIADGGNVEIVEISEENDLTLSLIGNCKSCNMSAMTFRAGVEDAIKKEVPEVKSVTEINQIMPN